MAALPQVPSARAGFWPQPDCYSPPPAGQQPVPPNFRLEPFTKAQLTEFTKERLTQIPAKGNTALAILDLTFFDTLTAKRPGAKHILHIICFDFSLETAEFGPKLFDAIRRIPKREEFMDWLLQEYLARGGFYFVDRGPGELGRAQAMQDRLIWLATDKGYEQVRTVIKSRKSAFKILNFQDTKAVQDYLTSVAPRMMAGKKPKKDDIELDTIYLSTIFKQCHRRSEFERFYATYDLLKRCAPEAIVIDNISSAGMVQIVQGPISQYRPIFSFHFLNRLCGLFGDDVMPYLMKNGADPKKKVNGLSPLHTISGQPDAVIPFLVEELGMSIDKLDDQHRTPLNYSVVARMPNGSISPDRLTRCAAFLRAGANASIPDAHKRTPIENARLEKSKEGDELVALFEQHSKGILPPAPDFESPISALANVFKAVLADGVPSEDLLMAALVEVEGKR